MIETVTIEFSPAFYALPYAIPIMLQMIGWLNESFNCTQFKIVDRDADIYMFMANEGNYTCGYLGYGEYLGCWYSDGRIILHEGLFGIGKEGEDWTFAMNYRYSTLIHEFQHYFTPYMFHNGKEMETYYKNRRC